MLRLTCERAQVADGMDILELGCGWGSLTLWMAECFPNGRITAVSNSAPQRRFIQARCKERDIQNVTVLTADMNDFQTDGRFDRVVSVEMFEHLTNYEEMLARISGWLRESGKLFLHVFSHREFVYPFQTTGETDWIRAWAARAQTPFTWDSNDLEWARPPSEEERVTQTFCGT